MADAMETPEPQDFEQNTARFIKWFVAADGTRLSSKVELRDLRNHNSGRGAVARENIDEDEELFAIPRTLVLSTATSSIPASVLEPLKDDGAWPPLIVAIIYEYLRKEKSSWHPYFQVLPTSFDSLMFWNDQELAELQASAVVDKIGKEAAEDAWGETIIPIMLQHPDLFPISAGSEGEKTAQLVDLAHMAGSLIMAYAFDIDRDDDAKNEDNHGASDDDEFEEDDEDEPWKGMVPLADMLNADADRNNARLFQEQDYLIMKTTKSISAGEQIFNDYGPLPRSDLLRMYGYITDNYSQYDVVEISHDLLLEVAGKSHGSHDTVWCKRQRQLDELDLLDDGYAIPRPGQGVNQLHDVVPGQLHMLLRALCAHDKDEGALKKPKEGVTVEEAALLQSALIKKLSDYSTTYELDQALITKLHAGELEIPSTSNPKRYSMAIQVRMGEKEILHHLITLCQDHIKRKSEETASLATNGATKRKHDGESQPHSKKAARTEKNRK